MLTPRIKIHTGGFIEFNRMALLSLGSGANKIFIYKTGKTYHLMEADQDFMDEHHTDYYQVTRGNGVPGIVVNNNNLNTIGILLDMGLPLETTTFKLIKSKLGNRKSYELSAE